MLETLRRLTEITAPSGCEGLLYDTIRAELAGYADEITADALGSLIVHKRGSGKRVMFSAHIDEIGVMATYIADGGFVSFANIGGVNPYYALAQRVRFTNGAVGVIGADISSEDTMKKLKISDLYIDLGVSTREEAEKLVSVGDCAGFIGGLVTAGDCAVSKSMDDRAGCAVLIEAIKRIGEHENDLYFVFSYGEELGLRGAGAAAFSIEPDFGVAVDVTRTGDCPGKLKMAVSLGGGAAVKIKDSSVMCHPYIKKLMCDTAEKYGIKYQLEVLEEGGTDAGSIHLSRGGVPSGCISVPTRYIHSPSEMINLKDLDDCAELAAKLCEVGFR